MKSRFKVQVDLLFFIALLQAGIAFITVNSFSVRTP